MDYEEEILSIFFTNVAQLCFDKAKEVVEKEREVKQGTPGPWVMLLTHLAPLAMAERSYLDLGSMITKNKGFLRKDNSLRSMYDTMRSDFRRVEDIARNDRAISTVSSQLCQFLSARIELIDFYEKMHQAGTSKQVRFEEMLSVIEDIADRFSLMFAHISLTSVKTAFNLECEILLHLLKAQVEMQSWHFLPSLMALHGANTRLSAWERTLQSKEVWKLTFGTSFLKANQQPMLFQWLVKFKNISVSKFSLYFHSILAQQATPTDMKALGNKQTFDPYHKIQSFQKKYDAACTCVMLVLDARGLEDYSGPGYHHPKKPVEAPKDMECFPIMVSYPVKPAVHMPNITKAIMEQSLALATNEKRCHSILNLKDQCTYFMSSIDPRVFLIVIFDSKRADREAQNIANFIQEMTLQLKCNKVFADLKPSSK
ncbi:KICSTOR complex protein C12orf66-like protein [Frankliniella fusca]|uniref:KICSTOR subunit 2 n=1 Tax=Frankliniella fusca TaxID=407009 RepID=A0AAE1HG08_9NEOP|nr:KICSTOR complex protein C12orf66-like protein [Frankliniella fusca]